MWKSIAMKAAVTVYALVWVAASAFAQYEPSTGCAGCGVYGYVDVPASSVTVSNAALLARAAAVEGWGFECYSGNAVDRVDVFVEDEAQPGVWRGVPSANPEAWMLVEPGAVYRPDVENAWVAACPAIKTRSTGFIRWVDAPLPLGAHRFLFVLWKGPYHSPTMGDGALIKTLNIVP